MSSAPRLIIHWGGSERTPGTWYLGLFGRYERKAGGGRRRRGWVISLRGLVVWVLCVASVSYLVGAALIWQRQARRPYNEVTYADVLLYPGRKDEIRLKRGRAMIAEGREALREGRTMEGFTLLRDGLMRYPHDLEARLLVVRFFLAARVRLHAQEFLMEGLDYGWPGRDYLESALAIVTSSEDHELAIAICDRALVLHDPARHPAADRIWLHAQRLRAALGAGDHEAVIAYLDAHADEIEPVVANETRLLALFALGRAEEALELVEKWRASEGETIAVLRLAVRTYRENNLTQKMDEALEALRRLAPADPRMRVYAIVQNLLAGREAGAAEQIDDFIFRFGGDARNFTMLAAPLGEIGRLAELDMVLAAAKERGFGNAELGLIRVRALVNVRKWKEARADIASLRGVLQPAEASGAALVLNYYDALMLALLDPARGAQSSFVALLRPLQLSLAHYRQAIELLRQEGRGETAREVITFAEGVFPDNAGLVRLRQALDEELAAARAASAPVEAKADEALATPAAFFAALAKHREGGDAAAALALLREARRARPVWLEGEEQSIARTELSIMANGDDLVALQSAARVYLNGDPVRARAVISLATELHADGRAEKARLLLLEVLRRTPDDARAVQVMDQLFPKNAGSAPDGKSAPVLPKP